MGHLVVIGARNTLLTVGLALSQLAHAQMTTAQVKDPRPVAAAALMLEAAYGVPITYEDPLAVNESQLEDVTEQVQRTPDPSHRVIVQKQVAMSFSYMKLDTNSRLEHRSEQRQAEIEADVSSALSNVLQNYAVAGGPVTFSVTEENGVFHILPRNFLNKRGRPQQMSPVLDTKLTIAPKPRSRQTLLNEIVQGVTQTTGIRVVVGTIPFNANIMEKQTSISGTDVTARSLLIRLLDELSAPVPQKAPELDSIDKKSMQNAVVKGSSSPLSWRLLYGPGWGYALNIHQVSAASQ